MWARRATATAPIESPILVDRECWSDMRYLLRILAFSALLIVSMIPITGVRLPADATEAVGFIAGMVAFVSTICLGFSSLKPERWVTHALLFMGAGAVGATVWWTIDGRGESLAGSALLGAVVAFAAFLPDSWVVGLDSRKRNYVSPVPRRRDEAKE